MSNTASLSPQDKLKLQAAQKAINFIEPGSIVGVGTGSTTNFFIDLLAEIKDDIQACVASSEQTKQRLEKHGIEVIELNEAGTLPIYVDGADEVDPHKNLIKGGGGALTREKIIASASQRFICMVDESKQVNLLGDFGVPIEILPIARSYVARELVKLGFDPVLRDGFITDNGNIIIDAHSLQVSEPYKYENAINNISGVVCCGLFAQRKADIVLVAAKNGLEVL